MPGPKITKIEVHQFKYEVADMARGMRGPEYSPGSRHSRTAYALKILTDEGVTGEYVGGSAVDYASFPSFTDYLIGKGALERERIYRDVKLLTRQNARIGMAPLDIALWDLAGKYHGAPINQLLGGYKTTLPTYVATLHGEEKGTGSLDSAEAYADFAEQCLDLRYAGSRSTDGRIHPPTSSPPTCTPSEGGLAGR